MGDMREPMGSVTIIDSRLDLLRKLYKNRRTCKYVDVYLEPALFGSIDLSVSEKNGFPAHKLILQNFTFFEKIFKNFDENGGNFESNYNKTSRIKMDTKPEIIEVLLRFMYTGEVTISDENLVDLLNSGQKYELEGLVKLCEPFIKPSIFTKNNWLWFFKYSLEENNAEMKEMILNYLKTISADDDFADGDFLLLDIYEIRILLNSKNKIFPSQDSFILSYIKWITKDPTRSIYIKEFSQLKWENFDVIQISDSDSDHEVIEKNIEPQTPTPTQIKPKVPQNSDQTFSQNNGKNKRLYEKSQELNSNSNPIKIEPPLKKICTIPSSGKIQKAKRTKGRPKKVSEIQNTGQNSQKTGENSQNTSENSQITISNAIVNDQIKILDIRSLSPIKINLEDLVKKIEIIFFVPQENVKLPGHLYSFSLENEKIKKFAELPRYCTNFKLICSGKKVYMMGGQDERNNSVGDINSFPLAWKNSTNSADGWIEEEKMHQRVRHFCPVLYKKAIYTLGGLVYTNSSNYCVLDSVSQLSLDGNEKSLQWDLCFNMKYTRAHCAATIMNNILYMSGGEGRIPSSKKAPCGLKSVEMLDLNTRESKVLRYMTQLRCNHQLISFNNKLYAIGGKTLMKKSTRFARSNSVEIYDPCINDWLPGPPMKHERADFIAFVMDDSIYALGGNEGEISMEKYLPKKNTWILLNTPKFPEFSDFFSSTVVHLSN